MGIMGSRLPLQTLEGERAIGDLTLMLDPNVMSMLGTVACYSLEESPTR